MNITVPEEYIQGFTRANNTFLYQLVFDPINRKLVPLNAYGDDIDPETLIYAGRYPLFVETAGWGNKDEQPAVFYTVFRCISAID